MATFTFILCIIIQAKSERKRAKNGILKINEICSLIGGSITGEHGIGLAKTPS